MLKSALPQIPLFLIHDDPCEALVKLDLQFVLSEHITTTADILIAGWAKKLVFTA